MDVVGSAARPRAARARAGARALTVGVVVAAALIVVCGCGGGDGSGSEGPGELGRSVNPFVGTGGIPWALGMLFPGPTVPFGMVRLSPDTSFAGGLHLANVGTAGYYHDETFVFGFSHTRLSGTGATDGGAFRVTPARGRDGGTLPVIAGRARAPAAFSKESEHAEPGLYRVRLPELGVDVALSSTIHAGVHRYRFDPGASGWLLVDATSSLTERVEDGLVSVDAGRREVSGKARTFGSFAGRYGGLEAFFVARFDRPFRDWGTWRGAPRGRGEEPGFVAGRAEVGGEDVGAALRFVDADEAGEVSVAVGLSYVSLANARENLDAEVPEVDVDRVRRAARDDWERALGRVRIETGDEQVRRVFYTALYHCMIMPTHFTDVNGEYLGFGRRIGRAEGFTYRTDLSLWDTFRTEHPLLALVAPEIQRDSALSLVEMARIGGTFPRWPAGGGYSGSMFGSPAHMVLAETWAKGIDPDLPVDEVVDRMVREAFEPPPTSDDPTISPRGRDAIDACVELGWCPDDEVDWSVSRTLEYAWADAAAAGLAEAVGRVDDARRLRARAFAYRNTWNPETRYFQARRRDGSWYEGFEPNANPYLDEAVALVGGEHRARAYAEGSARQYRYSVPQDPAGLIELFGGPEPFVRDLDGFLADASERLAAAYPGPGYWHGNQHDMHVIFLFDEAGRPDLTQRWTRWALTTRYDDTEVGLDGNDDGGTLSAWYVLAGGLGLYPVAGTDRYWITSPIVEGAEASLGGGARLTVTTRGQAPDHPYIQRVEVDGERLCEPWLGHDRIGGGAHLHFELGPEPAPDGGFACP